MRRLFEFVRRRTAFVVVPLAVLAFALLFLVIITDDYISWILLFGFIFVLSGIPIIFLTGRK